MTFEIKSRGPLSVIEDGRVEQIANPSAWFKQVESEEVRMIARELLISRDALIEISKVIDANSSGMSDSDAMGDIEKIFETVVARFVEDATDDEVIRLHLISEGS